MATATAAPEDRWTLTPAGLAVIGQARWTLTPAGQLAVVLLAEQRALQERYGATRDLAERVALAQRDQEIRAALGALPTPEREEPMKARPCEPSR